MIKDQEPKSVAVVQIEMFPSFGKVEPPVSPAFSIRADLEPGTKNPLFGVTNLNIKFKMNPELLARVPEEKIDEFLRKAQELAMGGRVIGVTPYGDPIFSDN